MVIFLIKGSWYLSSKGREGWPSNLLLMSSFSCMRTWISSTFLCFISTISLSRPRVKPYAQYRLLGLLLVCDHEYVSCLYHWNLNTNLSRPTISTNCSYMDRERVFDTFEIQCISFRSSSLWLRWTRYLETII